MNSLVALQGANPQINTLAAFERSQANALNAKSARLAHTRAAMDQLAAIGLGLKGGKLDGEVNTEVLPQALDMLGKAGVPNEVLTMFRDDPGMIDVMTRSALDARTHLAQANSDRDADLAERRMDLAFQEYAESRAARAEARARPIEINGQLIDPNTREVLGDYRSAPAGTSAMQEYQLAVSQGYEGTFPEYQMELKKAGATNVTTNVNDGGGQSQLASELGKGLAADALSQREDAVAAANLIPIINEGRALLDQGAITGALSGWKVGAIKLASSLGIDIPQNAADNSEAFKATMGNAVAQIIKQFGAGTGLSDADREYASNIAGGNVELNETAIRKIFDIADRASRGKISAWENRLPSLTAGDIPSALRVEMPAPYTPGASQGAGAGWTDLGDGIRIRPKVQ